MPNAFRTILIVDDDALIRRTFESLFRGRGYNVLSADNGESALQILAGHSVDTILLDILMPRKEGLETLIEVKRLSPATQVFVMTGGVTRGPDFLKIATRFGADGVVQKPISASALLKLVGDSGQSSTAQQRA